MGRHDAKMKAEIGVILLQAKGPQRLSAKPQKWGEPGIEPASGSGGTSPSHTLTSDSRPPDRERMTLLSKLSRLWSSAGPPQAPDHSCPLWTAHGQHLPASTENLTPSLVVGPSWTRGPAMTVCRQHTKDPLWIRGSLGDPSASLGLLSMGLLPLSGVLIGRGQAQGKPPPPPPRQGFCG